MAFTYTGGGNGSFNASGALPDDTDERNNRDWAAAIREVDLVGVVGHHARGGGRYDLVILEIPRLTVGTAPIEPDCTTECAVFFFVVNGSDFSGEAAFLCGLNEGSLTIAEISTGRVRGSFQGSGTCLDPLFGETPFTVSAGTFDVPFEDPEL